MYRIGIATTDGIVVNQHFGRADQFLIYEADENKQYRQMEYRRVTPVCNGGEHDDGYLLETVKKLADLDILLVSRVGIRAQQVLEQNGLTVFEMPGIIQESITRALGFIEVQKLLNGE